MKRGHLGVLLALVLPAISVYAQGERAGGEGRGGGGGGGHGAAVSRGYSGHGGTAFRPGFGGRGGFAHGGGFHGNRHGSYGRGYGRGYYYRRGYRYGYGGLIYGYGLPYCYPYYGSPYYGAPAYADYGDEPDDGYAVPPAYPYDAPVVTSDGDSSQTATYTAQDVQGYYQVGDQWGAGMKQYKLTMSQLVTYLQSYIVDASPAQQDAFRNGFIASAIPNGAAAFDQAMQQAVPQS